jgi:hypothetical protein
MLTKLPILYVLAIVQYGLAVFPSSSSAEASATLTKYRTALRNHAHVSKTITLDESENAIQRHGTGGTIGRLMGAGQRNAAQFYEEFAVTMQIKENGEGGLNIRLQQKDPINDNGETVKKSKKQRIQDWANAEVELKRRVEELNHKAK